MLIPLRNCQNLEVDKVRLLYIHIHTVLAYFFFNKVQLFLKLPLTEESLKGNQRSCQRHMSVDTKTSAYKFAKKQLYIQFQRRYSRVMCILVSDYSQATEM